MESIEPQKTVRHWAGFLIWKIANKIARLGCWARGSHVKLRTSAYCRQCGLLESRWKLPAFWRVFNG